MHDAVPCQLHVHILTLTVLCYLHILLCIQGCSKTTQAAPTTLKKLLHCTQLVFCKLFCAPQDSIPYGKPVLVAEVCRPSPSSSSQDVAKLAADYVAWGVDAIAVATDLEETPAGLSDLFAVCRAVKVPVLQWDWFLHPLQVKHSLLTGQPGIILGLPLN